MYTVSVICLYPNTAAFNSMLCMTYPESWWGQPCIIRCEWTKLVSEFLYQIQSCVWVLNNEGDWLLSIMLCQSFSQPTFIISLTDSYRPVSILPLIAETLERVVFNQLSSFLSKNQLLNANQSGFRCRHSTETALLCHWSPANCKSWFQDISSHSVGSICCFWHC